MKGQKWGDAEEQSKKLLNNVPSFKELQKIYIDGKLKQLQIAIITVFSLRVKIGYI